MKSYFLKTLGTMALAGLISTCTFAQKTTNADKLEDNEQIVIKKTGDKKTKVTVEINNGEVKINGKPISEYKGEDIEVTIENGDLPRLYSPAARSAFRNSNSMIYHEDSKPVLGVTTNDDEDGAKITTVTKGSGAEKAGLKAGDVITKVNSEKIENARALTTTISKLKPEEKVTVTIKRAGKEEKLTATLGKRSSTTTYQSPDVRLGDWDMNMNMDNMTFNSYSLNRGRLGIKAQDTEDEKGVKVLEVDAESHAAKSGIKVGDIIMKFDGEEVNSAVELAEAARDAREKNIINVTVSRDGKTQNIDIKIPKKLKTATL